MERCPSGLWCILGKDVYGFPVPGVRISPSPHLISFCSQSSTVAITRRRRLIGKSAVLKTAVRKDLGVRVPPPPLHFLSNSSQNRKLPTPFFFLSIGNGRMRQRTCDSWSTAVSSAQGVLWSFISQKKGQNIIPKVCQSDQAENASSGVRAQATLGLQQHFADQNPLAIQTSVSRSEPPKRSLAPF